LYLHSFPTRRSSDLGVGEALAEEGPDGKGRGPDVVVGLGEADALFFAGLLDLLLGEQVRQGRVAGVLAQSAQDTTEGGPAGMLRSEEHTSELQSLRH